MRGVGLRRGKLVRHRWAYRVVLGSFQRVSLPPNIDFFQISIYLVSYKTEVKFK